MSADSAAPAAPQSYRDMNDADFKAAVIAIIRSSATVDEVQRRVRDELAYPYTIAINAADPPAMSEMGAAGLGFALGGVQLSTLAMVQVMAHGPSGAVIHI